MLPLLQKLSLISFLSFLYSCSHTSKNEIAVLKALDRGLANSNLTIDRQTRIVYKTLENKMEDPLTHYKGATWYPKAMMAQKLSSGMFDFIMDLRIELLKEAGFNRDHPSFDEDDKEAVSKLFSKERKSEELFQKLKSYKDSMLWIDPIINQEFHGYLLVPNALGNGNDNEDSVKALFQNISTAAAVVVLTQFQNNVKVFENKVASFCNQQIGVIDGPIDAFPTAIISQSSKYVKANEELEIIAGIGRFEMRYQPEVLINNKAVEIGDYGYAELKLKVSSKPGTYSLPVKIEFTDQDGIKREIDRIVKYTIIE